MACKSETVSYLDPNSPHYREFTGEPMSKDIERLAHAVLRTIKGIREKILGKAK